MSKDDQETAEDYKDDTVVPGEPAVVSNVFFFHLSSLETKDGWKRKKKNKTKCNTPWKRESFWHRNLLHYD